MARIAGVDLPRNKRANIALTYIYGIGNPRAARILDAAKVDPMKKVQDLGEDEVNRIRQVIEAEGMVEGDLRKEVSMNIKRSSKSVPTAATVIAGTCRSAVNGPTPTREPGKVRAREQWQPRRNRRPRLRKSAASF